jgi:tRNA nucleotidyltransferase (CCA-adding enzyme)
MSADSYLYDILAREAVDTGPASTVRNVQATLMPAIREWGGDKLNIVHPSGSFAKGTANKSGTDIDLFISLLPTTSETLKEVYTKLGGRLRELGYVPRQQNVSWNIKVDGIDVDLVPARQQGDGSEDHSLFRRR